MSAFIPALIGAIAGGALAYPIGTSSERMRQEFRQMTEPPDWIRDVIDELRQTQPQFDFRVELAAFVAYIQALPLSVDGIQVYTWTVTFPWIMGITMTAQVFIPKAYIDALVNWLNSPPETPFPYPSQGVRKTRIVRTALKAQL